MRNNNGDGILHDINMFFERLIERPMSIGTVCCPAMGGSGIIATEIAVELAKRGHKSNIISYQKPYRLISKKVKLHIIPTKSFQAFQYFPVTLTAACKIEEVVKKEKIDVLNVHYAIPFSIASYLAKQMVASQGIKVPMITTVHGTDVHTIGLKKEFRSIVKFTLENSDGITAVAKYLADKLNENFDMNQNVKIIPNFVDAKRFRRINIPRKDERKIIVHVSNFRKIKRVDNIVKSFYKINKTIPSRLLLVGSGPEEEYVRKLVKKYKLTEDVSFLGARRDVEKIYSAADLFLMASEREACPLSILEAMSCSVPIVTTAVGGIPEIVENGKNGFLVEYNNPGAMAEKSLKILSSDELRRRIAKFNRKTVIKKFTADKIIPEYERYYRRLEITS